AALVVTGAAVTQLSACKSRSSNTGDNDVGLALILTFVIGTILPLLSAPGSATAATGRKHSPERGSAQQLIGGITKSHGRAMVIKHSGNELEKRKQKI